jgi:CRP/FNR family transcriptional regulator, cyclic AMP receptor protein
MRAMFAEHKNPALRFLDAHPWFAQLPEAQRTDILHRVTVQRGSKGEVMLRAGDGVKGWYAVLDGLVKLQSQSAQGRLSVFLGISGGDWFGEGSAMKPEPRRYDVIALRDSQLMCLPASVFDTLRATSLAFNQALVAHMNVRLGQAMAFIEAERIRSPEQRVALYLSPMVWRGSTQLNLSQEELGNLVGLSRQTVNKVLKSLQLRGLVSVEFGRVVIHDKPGLIAFATQCE